MSRAAEIKQQIPLVIKAALLVIAAAFLAYSVFWAVNGVVWANSITHLLSSVVSGQTVPISTWGTTHLTLLFIQEYASVINCYLQLACAVFAFYSAILYVKSNPKYFAKLRLALIFLSLFYLLLVPASIHHLVGTVLSWEMVSIYVGLSYLLQAVLIVPPLLILSQKMRIPQNTNQILKLAKIASPLFVFALWFKYLFLWIDTLAPMNTQIANPLNIVGTVNSLFTLLVASALIAAGGLMLNENRASSKKLLAAGLIFVGAFFIIYTIVSLFVTIYASFWYLTDFWMLTLPILGIALLSYFGRRK